MQVAASTPSVETFSSTVPKPCGVVAMRTQLWNSDPNSTRSALLSTRSTLRGLMTRAILIIAFGTTPLGGVFLQRPNAETALKGAAAGEVLCKEPDLIFAQVACCSEHGGVCGCQGGADLCCDGTVVACPCSGLCGAGYAAPAPMLCSNSAGANAAAAANGSPRSSSRPNYNGVTRCHQCFWTSTAT